MQKRLHICILTLILLASGSSGWSQIINTIAGQPVAGLSGDGGPANAARLFFPTSVALDGAGNLFVSDAANRRIRKISTAGTISTVVGSGCGFSCWGFGGDGGPATNAQLYYPTVIVLDTFSNMYIADYGNFRIRKVNAAGIIKTIAGNGSGSGYLAYGVPATNVSINFANLAVDGAGNIYFGTGYNFLVVSPSGIVNNFAGVGTLGYSGDGGPATDAQLNGNGYVVADMAGNVYISDNANYCVRKVNPAGIISTVAGNGSAGNSGDGGPATNARLVPFCLSLDKVGNLYVTDTVNECVRRVDVFGSITTIAGTGTAGFSGDGGPATLAKLYKPGGVAVDAAGNIYIADGTNNRIRKIGYGDRAPHFTGSHVQSVSFCQYSAFDSLNAYLSVLDSDALQLETWSALALPAHGTLAASCSTVSTGSVLTPSGLYYTPTAGYTGPDTFKIKISDGLISDSMLFYVTVAASPGSISGSALTCAGMSFALSDTIGPGTWSSSNTAVATIGAATGTGTAISAGTVTITYTPVTGCINTRVVTVNAFPTPISGPGGVCVGGGAGYTETVSGGTWYGSAPAVAVVDPYSGFLTAGSPGTDTLTYTMPAGCSVKMVVTVSPLPPAISGPAHVCPSATISLTDAVTGGVWFSSNPSVASVGLGTGTVTGVSTGITTISYTVTTGVSCTITSTLMVDAAPAPISGIAPICPGNSLFLSDSVPGGTWTSSLPSAISVGSASGAVSCTGAGTAIITYTLPDGCFKTAVQIANPLPSPIVGPAIFCAGSTANYTDAGSGTWTSSNNAVGSFTGPGLLTGISPGTDTITYTLPTGCATSLPVTVAALPAAISGAATVCLGSAMTFSDPSGSGTWSSSNPSVASVGSLTGLVTGLTSAAATITFTNATGCIAIKSIFVAPVPAAFTVTGGGVFCAGASGADVGLSGSLHGNSYSLQLGGVTLATLPGTNFALDFGMQTAGGVYTVLASNAGTGCSRTMTGSATLVANPLPPAISGPSAVCIGSAISVTDSGTGNWSSSFPAIASIGSASGIITGNTSGATIITYTLPTGCYITNTITVSTAPATINDPSSVCAGASVTLTDSIAGGTWSSSNTLIATVGSLTGLVSAITAGTVTITYSLGSGCTKTKPITVNALPAAISGPAGVCTGHTISLSNTTPGGSWSSLSPGVAAIGATSGIVSGIASGVAVIHYTTGAGCAAMLSVSVNAGPSSISGSLHACTGQVSILTDSAGGGYWSISPASVATIGSATGAVTGIAAGTATVSYSLGSGCATAATLTVTATPGPVTGAGVLCAGSNIAVADTTAGGTWSSSNTTIAAVSGTGVVTGNSAGAALISYTVGGCTATMPVTVDPLPAAVSGAAAVCTGSSVLLSDGSPGGTWSSSAPGIASITPLSGLVTGLASGTVMITYTSVPGCHVTFGMTVNAVPAPVTGGVTMCIGSTIALADASPGGTWVLGAGGSVISLTALGVVHGLSLGTAIVSYVVDGCPATDTLSVGPQPPAISGPALVCAGSFDTLTETGTGAWSSALPAVATVGSATGIVTGVAAGTASIIFSLGPGCTATKTVTVIALPAAISGPSSICTGAVAMLTDPATGGAWSSSAVAIATVGTTGQVTGTGGGIATISYTALTGCSATHLVSVVAVPPIALAHNICAWGDTISVTDSITTGLFTSSLALVNNFGGGLGRLTGNAPGIASVSYTIPAGCSTTRQFTVNPLPNLILGMTPLCSGDSLVLSDATPGGVWSCGAPSVAMVGSATGVVNGLAAGNAPITYTLVTTGCRTDTTLTVTGLPDAGVISGPFDLCNGSTVTLTDAVPGGVWTSGSVVAGVSGGIVSGLSPGTDTISYSVTNMCGTTTAHRSVTVNPVPAAGTVSGPDSICMGSTAALLLSGADTGGVWNCSNPGAGVSPSGIITAFAAGTDTVYYTVSNAWCSAQSEWVITIMPLTECLSLGAQAPEAPKNSVHFWPNPTDGTVNVQYTNDGILRLIDFQGRIIAVFGITSGAHSVTLPGSVTNGLYLLEFNSENYAPITTPILIERKSN